MTHVAHPDAAAYASWAGKSLPTESEWEFAARGGLEGAAFAWGDEFAPEGRMLADTWQGAFPFQNGLLDGYEGTSPVGTYPANGYGLFDVTGNVWEWTSADYTPNHVVAAGRSASGTSTGGGGAAVGDGGGRGDARRRPSRGRRGMLRRRR